MESRSCLVKMAKWLNPRNWERRNNPWHLCRVLGSTVDNNALQGQGQGRALPDKQLYPEAEKRKTVGERNCHGLRTKTNQDEEPETNRTKQMDTLMWARLFSHEWDGFLPWPSVFWAYGPVRLNWISTLNSLQHRHFKALRGGSGPGDFANAVGGHGSFHSSCKCFCFLLLCFFSFIF